MPGNGNGNANKALSCLRTLWPVVLAAVGGVVYVVTLHVQLDAVAGDLRDHRATCVKPSDLAVVKEKCLRIEADLAEMKADIKTLLRRAGP